MFPNTTIVKPFLLPLAIAVLVLLSCGNPNGHSTDVEIQEYRPVVPEDIEAVQTGFLESELTPEIFEFDKDSSRVACFGHVHSLMKFPELLAAFVDSIAAKQPDYVFVLGDFIFFNDEEEWELIEDSYTSFDCPVFFLPGNHDINFYREREEGIFSNWAKAEERYINHVGYRYKTIQDPLANYVLLNFNDSLERVKKYLNHAYNTIDTLNPTLVFSHQHLWDPKLSTIDQPKMWTAKKWKAEQIEKELTYADVLVSGDWNLKFGRGSKELNGRPSMVLAVGSRMQGDPLCYSILSINKEGIVPRPYEFHPLSESGWYEK